VKGKIAEGNAVAEHSPGWFVNNRLTVISNLMESYRLYQCGICRILLKSKVPQYSDDRYLPAFLLYGYFVLFFSYIIEEACSYEKL